ncbi:MaoC-like domain, partial [Trinorchestia longiramus]
RCKTRPPRPGPDGGHRGCEVQRPLQHRRPSGGHTPHAGHPAPRSVVGPCEAFTCPQVSCGAFTCPQVSCGALWVFHLPPDLYDTLKPEYVAPLVGWLCHEDCPETGGLFEAAGGWYGKYRFERSTGAVCRGSLQEMVTPEAVRNSWDKITSFEGALHPTSNEEAVGLLASSLQELPEVGGGSSRGFSSGGQGGATGPLSAVGYTEEASPFTYTSRDVILYGLGVGASTRNADYLRYLYENSDNFSAVPTFALIAAQNSVFKSTFLMGGLPSWTPDLTKLLHGEQYLELHKPLVAKGGTLHTAIEVVDVLDKRSGASVVVKGTTTDDAGEAVATTQFVLFIAGEGKFGGRRSNDAVVPLAEVPDTPPEASVDYTTSVDQAALYRLSGDLNPLHIDPSFAAMGGFSTPILHGLCSLGIACRGVLEVFCGGDPASFKAIKVRFVKPVLPGQTLTTQLWRRGDRIIFRCLVKETGETCLSGGYVDLYPSGHEDVPDTKGTGDAPSKAPEADAFFRSLAVRVAAEAVDLKTPPGSVYHGPPSGVRPDVTLTLEERHLLELVSGKLNAQKAFMSGTLRVTGNIMMSQKLKELFGDRSRL